MRRLLLFLGALLAALGRLDTLAQTPPAAPATSGAAIPLEYFTKYDEFSGMKISPDGEFIALRTGKYGRSALLFVDLKNKKIVSGVRAPENGEIDDYFWTSPTRLIYMLAVRTPDVMQPARTGEIFAINRDGSSTRQVYAFREERTDTRLATRKASFASAELLSTLKRDADHILIAETPWQNFGLGWRYNPDAKPLISRLDVYSGKKQQLDMAPLTRAELLLDNDDNVRFALGLNDRQRAAVSWKPEAKGAWSSFELEGFRDESVVPQRFSSDNRSVYLTGVRDGERFSALYRLDLQTRHLEKVHAFEEGGVAGVITDFADREIIGVRGYGDRAAEYWLLKDDPDALTHQALQRAFPQQRVTLTSSSDDGRWVIVFVDSDVNPGEYYLFDTASKHAEFLRAARNWIEPKQMRPKEPFALEARDGLDLHGYVTRPAGDGPHPMVVLPHGGPHGVYDTWEFEPEVQLLASRGYAVLQVNFRGSGGYGMDFQRAGYREWGGRMQDDITDATHWAIEQKIAAADRVCIYGVSYGGFAALMSAAREPDLYRCAIGYAGVYDLELMYQSGDVADSRSGLAYLERVLGNDVARLRAQSPTYNAQNIKVPVLLIHGKADWRAGYEQAEHMKAALQKNQKKFEWLVLGREGHGIYDEESRREVYERILQFLAANLNGRP
jgi:dipeptidyl aminopeptidase/acylaminoacyl peptidase